MRLATSALLAAAGLWTIASVSPRRPRPCAQAVIASTRAYDAGLKTLKDLLQAH